MTRNILVVLTMLGMLGAVAGCNTMAGLGKDVERGGQAVQDTAKDIQKKM